MIEISDDDLIKNLLEMVIRNYDCCLSCSAHLIVTSEKEGIILKKEFQIGQ